MRELALSYGVYANYQEQKKSVDEFIFLAMDMLTRHYNLKSDEILVVLAGNFKGRTGFSFIEVGSVDHLMDRVNMKDK
jgi:pyruvate kinase